MLPSTEEDPDPSFSFATPSSSSLATPTYVQGDSPPPSGVPPRLQTGHHHPSLTATDYASSAASSPCAASTDLSVDNDRLPSLPDDSAGQLPSDFVRTKSQPPATNNPHPVSYTHLTLPTKA